MSLSNILPLFSSRWPGLKSRTTIANVHLIANVPEYGSEYYHLILFPPDLESINYLKSLGSLPDDIINFYESHNGLIAFGGALSIYGNRKSYMRTGDASYEPYSLHELNTYIKNQSSNPNDIYIGGSSWDSSHILLCRNSLHIKRVNMENLETLETWNSFSDMISCEFNRISGMIDDRGFFYESFEPSYMSLMRSINTQKYDL